MLLIQKFGGTSVGNTDRIAHIAERIIATRKAGHDVVVVLSAMEGETNRLATLARTLSLDPDPREVDLLLSTGEQASVALLAMALLARGCLARSMNGLQAGILTDGVHTKARIAQIDAAAIQQALDIGRVPVVTGFQGHTPRGEITTLGRGGSDITAVALASALNADECQIFTDVDGVYTTDPRVVPEARRLDEISFDAMQAMAHLGAKVLHSRALEYAEAHRMPVRILSSFASGPGTLITYHPEQEGMAVSGVAFNRSQAKLALMGVSAGQDISTVLHDAYREAHLEFDMLVQSAANEAGQCDIRFAVAREDYPHAYRILDQLAKKLPAGGLLADNKVAKLSIVGVGFLSQGRVVDAVVEAMTQAGCPAEWVTASGNVISAVVGEKGVDLGVQALHQCFGLHEKAPGGAIFDKQ